MSKLSAASKGIARVGKIFKDKGLQKRGMDGVKASHNATALKSKAKAVKGRRTPSG